MGLSDKQLEIIHAEDKKICVYAAAGSGKTAVLTERIKYLLSKGVNPEGIFAITYTNTAAEEMRSRVNNELVHISTLHSLANHIAIDNGLNTTSIRDSGHFNQLISIVINDLSIEFPVVEYLLIDEFQDITDQQWDFVKALAPTNIFCVGDIQQCIYQFDKLYPANPQIMIDMLHSGDYKVFNLSTNYRCARPINNFAQQFCNRKQYSDEAIYCPKAEGYVNENIYDWHELIDYVQDSGEWGKWALLFRTKDAVKQCVLSLKQRGIPCEIVEKRGRSTAEMQQILAKNSVKVLTIHASKGLDFVNVGVAFEPENIEAELNLAYVAATRAENNLYWSYDSPGHLTYQQRKRIDKKLEDLSVINFE